MPSKTGLDDMHHAKKFTRSSARLQAGLSQIVQGLAIPPAAEMGCPPVSMVILPAREGGAIAAAMFEQQDRASRPAYPPHLAQCLYRVEECAGTKRRDDSVE